MFKKGDTIETEKGTLLWFKTTGGTEAEFGNFLHHFTNNLGWIIMLNDAQVRKFSK